ncbi:MAG: type II toxin-antitoxin system RelE/ParE family toxin [Methylotenera sp.]|nr:type II toxin-antitoxin system RelE/ParE family toxin [Methylotenera sp.]MDP1755693.1 type II toxin-antitoxin system RelE/ParE family toxin [Methylotenera sp.]MDP1960086.1 type II toxin-antitoxin system RelE/ParE family toxin [Methylotenera sp.]MDP3206580.1 type II toxin-antitoxin system RelE/ParE family toxin [Methylotenera sp.]MDP3304445.1 type II toxin-antitoxin system RelE/ParE family toxin [Methylotenera sp.]
MINVVYHDRARDDVLRLVDFLIEHDVDAALAIFSIIDDGISLLKKHPEIGRFLEVDCLRELIISRGRTGYIALYEFDELRDLIIVLRVKHQREAEFNQLFKGNLSEQPKFIKP